MISSGRQRIRRLVQELDRTRSVVESIPATAVAVSSTYAPPNQELGLALSPSTSATELQAQSTNVASRIVDFDNIFKNLMRLRAQRACAADSKKQRSVSFYPIANVILIPSRQEYHDAELAGMLWWTRKELKSFQLEAKRELRQIMGYAMYTRNICKTGLSLGGGMSFDQRGDDPASISVREEQITCNALLEDCT